MFPPGTVVVVHKAPVDGDGGGPPVGTVGTVGKSELLQISEQTHIPVFYPGWKLDLMWWSLPSRLRPAKPPPEDRTALNANAGRAITALRSKVAK
jgi:hypothetical protein